MMLDVQQLRLVPVRRKTPPNWWLITAWVIGCLAFGYWLACVF